MPEFPLGYHYRRINQAKTFVGLPEVVKEDLLNWNNVRDENDPEQLERLRKLYIEGHFTAWDCPECGERVYWAEPGDWGHFQGTCNADYTSYPGDTEKYKNEYLVQLCDTCRSRV